MGGLNPCINIPNFVIQESAIKRAEVCFETSGPIECESIDYGVHNYYFLFLMILCFLFFDFK